MNFLKRNWVILLLLFYAFSFIFRSDTSFEQDLGRHLKFGEIIWQTKQVPQINLISYTNPNFPFINHHWLFQLFVYLVSQTLGLTTLVWIKLLVLLTAIFLILKSLTHNSKFLVLLLGYLFLHLTRERIELRPEIFSFLFTSLTVYTLEKFTTTPLRWKPKLLWMLPVIQLLWTNTHIYFPLGLIIQGIYLVDNLKERRLSLARPGLLCLVFSTVVIFINPNFINGALYPLQVFQNYGYTVVENQSIFFLEKIGFHDPNFIFAKAAWLLLGLTVLWTLLRRRLPLKEFGLIGLGVGLSLMNMRSLPYLFFLSLAPLLRLIPGVHLRGGLWRVLLVPLVIIFLWESTLYLNGSYYKQKDSRFQVGLSLLERGKGALDFVLVNNLQGPIFNNFDIGSLIAYRTYPKLKVFVDGRPEAYPADFFQGVYIPIQYDYPKFKQLNEQLGFQTVIFSHTDQTPWAKVFLKEIHKDPEWKIVYLDDFIVILSNKSQLERNSLAEVNLKTLSPDKFGYSNHVSFLYLSSYLINVEEYGAATKFIAKTLTLYPKSPIANSIIGQKVDKSPWW